MHLRYVRGFTLVELVMTVFLLALIAGLTIPSLSGLVAQSRHSSALGDVRGLFALARSHALTTGKTVTICPLDEDSECIDQWSRQVSLFVDHDRDGKPDNGKTLRVIPATNADQTRYSRTAGRGYFRFSADGLSAGTLGSIVHCTPSSNKRSVISYIALSIGGRLRVQTEETSDGSMQLSWGAKVQCSPV